MIDWEIIKAIGPTTTAIIAAVLFFYNRNKDKKIERMQNNDYFLGDKEPLSFAAMKILREGFKGSDEEIKEQVYLIIQGCLFEGSDRARVLLYYIVSKHKNGKYASYFNEAYNQIIEASGELAKYNLTNDELDRGNFDLRVKVLEKIFNQT